MEEKKLQEGKRLEQEISDLLLLFHQMYDNWNRASACIRVGYALKGSGTDYPVPIDTLVKMSEVVRLEIDRKREQLKNL